MTVVDLAEIVRGEAAENFERKDFTWTEAVAIKRAVEPELKAEARERQIAGGKLKSEASGNLPEGTTGRAVDKIGAFAGVSGRTVEKIAKVVEAVPIP